MIYDELIEELALALLMKARYEGCISVADGFSQCEEDNIEIDYYVSSEMREMPLDIQDWPAECEPLLKKINAKSIGDIADYLEQSSHSEPKPTIDSLFSALLEICYENMDMNEKTVFWINMLENNSLVWRNVE